MDKNANNKENNLKKDFPLPYQDPAITNPTELASFPKSSEITDAKEVEHERESHLVNKRTPVREGRNITRTDNNPDNDGFM
ncbi:hypothetical protein ACX0HA_05335 [Flavobacterium hauense]